MYGRRYVSSKFAGVTDYIGPLVKIHGLHSTELDRVFDYTHDWEMGDDGVFWIALGSMHK
jgi:hypothetical protein